MTGTSPTAARIVVGVDGSPESKLALRWAARIADVEGAVIDAVAAWEFPPALGWAAVSDDYSPEVDMGKMATEAVDQVFGSNRPVGMTVRAVRGYPATVLLEASRDAVMLVVGSRGHGGFMGLLLGSVSARVAEHASCPVLVVHDKEVAASAGPAVAPAAEKATS